jgi:hypothetical protein
MEYTSYIDTEDKKERKGDREKVYTKEMYDLVY